MVSAQNSRCVNLSIYRSYAPRLPHALAVAIGAVSTHLYSTLAVTSLVIATPIVPPCQAGASLRGATNAVSLAW
ncbi:MAG: hypothetical protein QXR68_05070 [Pyrobaculum sp.]